MTFTQYVYKKFKISSEWSRKIAHISSGIVALSYPFFIKNHFIVLALTVSFTFILYYAKKKGYFSSIFSVNRKSYGELFFVWSTWFLFLHYQYYNYEVFYFLPLSIVVFADSLAAIIGKRLPILKYYLFGSQKSLGGSITFFVVTFFISYFFLDFYLFEYPLYYSLSLAMLLTITESFSVKGFDNITIPIVSVLLICIIF
jgi:dolichol kinase